jgi:16S rRNA (cytidine1402-2'-O)-methyltransferase
MKNIENGKLFVIPTPIGNIDDITLRAIKTIKNVDVIACEDKRVTSKLLNLLDIKDKRLISYHNHNEINSASGILILLKDGKNIGLVSDAGYPLISDPGYNLIKLCRENEIEICPLPGPSAILPALVGSGFESDSFVFLGFPPQKKGRNTFLDNAINFSQTVILFESPHRIIKLLEQLNEKLIERKVGIAREISKIYEEFIIDTPINLISYLTDNNKIKGEFVVLIERNK